MNEITDELEDVPRGQLWTYALKSAMRRVQAPWLTLALVALSQGTAAHTHALLRPNL